MLPKLSAMYSARECSDGRVYQIRDLTSPVTCPNFRPRVSLRIPTIKVQRPLRITSHEAMSKALLHKSISAFSAVAV